MVGGAKSLPDLLSGDLLKSLLPKFPPQVKLASSFAILHKRIFQSCSSTLAWGREFAPASLG